MTDGRRIVLAGDVGGTNARLAIVELEGRTATFVQQARYPSGDHAGLGSIVNRFRQETGMSPHDWLLARRLERACALLAGTRRPIADIALETGFSDQSVLTRAMRGAMDTTPAAYRKAAGEESHKTQ